MWPLLVLATLLSDGRTEFLQFANVGSLRATMRTAPSTTTVSSRYQDVCCGLCAASNWCTAVNYDVEAKTCQLVGNASLILSADSSSQLSLKVSSLLSSSSNQYRIVPGALRAAPVINGSRHYTLGPWAATASLCRIFCESLLDSCYAFQFNNATATCTAFAGNYAGDYLPVDATDSNWSLAYLVRPVDGTYRQIPGLYVHAPGRANPISVSGVMDPRRCQQLCEQQQQQAPLGASCQLFAHNVALSLCTVYVAAAVPTNLSANDSDANWTSYYKIGSDRTGCVGGTYYFPTTAMTQPQAEAFCNRAYGANLVRVDSQDEQSFLVAIFTGYSKISNNHVWLGASSDVFPYDFRWTCGRSSLVYTNWYPNEPNSRDEFCVNLYYDAGYQWNNIPCSCCNFYFVCEKCESGTC